jgi:hypothetical protein
MYFTNGKPVYSRLLQKNNWPKCAIREMGDLVGSAPACYGSSLGSSPDISEK